jgi:hypothetical protein
MKKSELRQLIREEIQNQLLNNVKLAKFIDNLDIPSSEFHPQDKDTVVTFIRDSKPSPQYLQKIEHILRKNNIRFNLSDFYYKPLSSSPESTAISSKINPYDSTYKKHYNYPSESGD